MKDHCLERDIILCGEEYYCLGADIGAIYGVVLLYIYACSFLRPSIAFLFLFTYFLISFHCKQFYMFKYMFLAFWGLTLIGGFPGVLFIL